MAGRTADKAEQQTRQNSRQGRAADRQIKSTSEFVSLILRHKPEQIGISLAEHGRADVQELIPGIDPSIGSG